MVSAKLKWGTEQEWKENRREMVTFSLRASSRISRYRVSFN